jgi:SAM-dependent methyltransferase
MPTYVPLPPRTPDGVPVTKSSRATGLVYTDSMPERDRVLAYYRRILPFYENESAARVDLAFWTALARQWKPKRILEIGSGLGRITTALQGQAPAVGLDISLEMLARASEVGARAGRASFVAADMRAAVFQSAFDLILAPSDPFSHLISTTDRQKALRTVAEHLSRRGRFVLEALYRPRRAPVSVHRQLSHEGGVLSIRETWRPAPKDSLWRARFAYCDRPARGRPRRLTASFVARCWDAQRIRSFFLSCGLTIRALWGDWDQTPFEPGSPRLIVVAQKLSARAQSLGRKNRRLR